MKDGGFRKWFESGGEGCRRRSSTGIAAASERAPGGSGGAGDFGYVNVVDQQ